MLLFWSGDQNKRTRIRCRTMELSYKISDEQVVCIKFRSESTVKEALLHNPDVHNTPTGSR